ncbi:related to RKM2 - ribosomal protein lysine methyltransferase [Ustilago trichophora]|uniref:Related to RKM2 - ribosomal protein lysine methyltransferase n=1 Tax=Ustilago trichophora TaxID=86804 RepID=A0A5C3ECK0_9BASI|nr:related to RKM2 - ribosomal protein lysine methyltransferase [Ustilago trichophora]
MTQENSSSSCSSSSSVVEQNRVLSALLSLHPSASSKPGSSSSAVDVAVQVSDRVPAGRGLVFTHDIKPGQQVLSLPSDALINVKSYKSFFHPDTLPIAVGIAGSSKKGERKLSSSQLLSLLIARAKMESELRRGQDEEREAESKKHETLRLFVRTLPKRFESAPLSWSLLAHSIDKDSKQGDEETDWKRRFFQTLLLAFPSHSRELSNKVRRRFEQDWLSINSMRANHPDLLAEPSLLAINPDLARRIIRSIDLNTYLWAWLCVNSRCVFLPLSLADHSDNFTLAPMLDMANHTPDPALECKVRYASDGGLELCGPISDVSPSGLKGGDECFITYGPHSNQSLLCEYGFVLPPQLEFAAEGDDGGNGARWKGSRYVDVLMDQEIETMLKAQGKGGEAKIELLQNRGYWGEFTIHPYPEPAHPSHRLIPALRLAALDLHAPAPAATSKVAKTHHQPGVKAGKKAFPVHQSNFAAQGSASDLDKWEETLTGYRDIVSEENERHAHLILVDLCESKRKDTEQARIHLVGAEKILQAHGDDGDEADANGLEPGREGCRLSLSFVKQLLDEEDAVLRLVGQAARDQVEW